MPIITCSNPHAADYNPNSYTVDPAATERHATVAHTETYTGCVLKTGEHNYHDDSDFYALVWDETSQQVREIEYATTRGWTYHNKAVVDATPDVRAKAIAWETARLTVTMTAETLARIDLGTEVRSLTTRGKNKGLVGTVEWIGKNNYGPGQRVGIHVDGEKTRRYLDMDRVTPTRTELTAEESADIAYMARARARRTYGA